MLEVKDEEINNTPATLLRRNMARNGIQCDMNGNIESQIDMSDLDWLALLNVCKVQIMHDAWEN